ncbi:MAG: hypothetical protein ACR2IV_17920 [Bryobacteraceae bacterium]
MPTKSAGWVAESICLAERFQEVEVNFFELEKVPEEGLLQGDDIMRAGNLLPHNQ